MPGSPRVPATSLRAAHVILLGAWCFRAAHGAKAVPSHQNSLRESRSAISVGSRGAIEQLVEDEALPAVAPSALIEQSSLEEQSLLEPRVEAWLQDAERQVADYEHNAYEAVWQAMKKRHGVKEALQRIRRIAQTNKEIPGVPDKIEVPIKPESAEAVQSFAFALHQINLWRQQRCMPKRMALEQVSLHSARRFQSGETLAEEGNTIPEEEPVLSVRLTLAIGELLHSATVTWWDGKDVDPAVAKDGKGLLQEVMTRLQQEGRIATDASPVRPFAKLEVSASSCEIDVAGISTSDELMEFWQDHHHTWGIIEDPEKQEYQEGVLNQIRAGNIHSRRRVTLPNAASWKDQAPACFNEAPDQDSCGASYMFAALGSVRDRRCLHSEGGLDFGPQGQLSEQMALLCEPMGRQCSGGWASVAFDYIQKHWVESKVVWGFERSCLSDTVCRPSDPGCKQPEPVVDYSSKCAGATGDFFFGEREADNIMNWGDAQMIAFKKCESVGLDAETCDQWAADRFKEQKPEMPFEPDDRFCAALAVDKNDYYFAHEDESAGSVLLEVEETAAIMRRAIPLKEDAPLERSLSRKQNQPSSRRRNCDRSRCSADKISGQPLAVAWHFVPPTVDSVKNEIFQEGPMYVSFSVKEDFSWFFHHFPMDAYSHQWGLHHSGHAAVLVGWEDHCVYHTTGRPAGILAGERESWSVAGPTQEDGSFTGGSQPELLTVAEADPELWGKDPEVVRRRIDRVATLATKNIPLARQIHKYLMKEFAEAGNPGDGLQAYLAETMLSRAGSAGTLSQKDAKALRQAELFGVISKGQSASTLETTVKNKNAPAVVDPGTKAHMHANRDARGQCWLLRNSWGAHWGDSGFFRWKQNVLTSGAVWSLVAGDVQAR